MWQHPIHIHNVTILTHNGIIGNGVRIAKGKIAGISTPDSPLPILNSQLNLDGNGGLLLPGLINAHDHLALNNFPRLKYHAQYNHSLDWIKDIEAHFNSDPQITTPKQQKLNHRLWQGGLKNLLSGVTTVCHHNPLHPPLRRHFPVRVVQKYGFCHSLFRGGNVRHNYQKASLSHPWIIHLAEGIDERANQEFETLQEMGAIGKNTILVHGVGLTDHQQTALIKNGRGLIWCPSSNLFMFGQTAQVTRLANAGILALATDSRLSGSQDLLHEIQIAWQTNQLSAKQLLATVGKMPASMLNLTNGEGDIQIGGVADLLLLPPPTDNPTTHLFQQKRADIQMVMLGGKIMVSAPQYAPAFGKWGWASMPVLVDGVKKNMARWLVKRSQKSTVPEPGFIP